jgi:4-methylaminobutanoate oxidase (formaldehyde-forming)
VTYVGELGWELYPATEYGVALWDTLTGAGRPFGLVPGGYRAIDSLRLEKGYLVWGADITSETDPYSSGLGFAVNADKEFLGREALAGPDGTDRRLVTLVLDDNRAVAFGNEPVRTTGGDVIGRVSSGGVGYFLDASIALAWVPSVVASGDRLTVEAFGRQISATVTDQPLYDATGSRLRT